MKGNTDGVIRPYSAALIQFGRLLDAVAIFLVLRWAVAIHGQQAGQVHTSAALLAIAAFAIYSNSLNLYRSWRIAPIHSEISIICRSWAVSALLVCAAFYACDYFADFPRRIALTWFVATPLLISSTRVATRLTLRGVRLAGRNFRHVAIIGATPIGRRAQEKILGQRSSGQRFIGYFDDRKAGADQRTVDVPLAGSIDELLALAKGGQVDTIYVALPMRAEERIKTVMDKFADTTASIFFIPDFSVFDLLQARWEHLGTLPIVRLVDTPIHGFNALLKRVEDLVLASIILLLVALPMLIIAVLIRRSSPGPVFFRQRRYGLGGKDFYIWKFRTMTVTEDGASAVQARPQDPRVTPFGAFLRRTSLDELPQFINVLQGTMSIVGPRPHPIRLNEQFRGLVHRYMLRHKVRPGITGWAQVNGYRGETDTLEKMERRLEYDLEYVHNWSLWFDLRIIVLTILRGFRDGNAY